LPVDVIAQGADGHALAFDQRNRPSWIPLAPSFAVEPWRTLRQLELPSRQWDGPPLERGR
jgi:hypothetical protein